MLLSPLFGAHHVWDEAHSFGPRRREAHPVANPRAALANEAADEHVGPVVPGTRGNSPARAMSTVMACKFKGSAAHDAMGARRVHAPAISMD